MEGNKLNRIYKLVCSLCDAPRNRNTYLNLKNQRLVYRCQDNFEMPLYEVCHSSPLSREQKTVLAKFITRLHSTTFLTPALFVMVRFTKPEASGDFFVAGEPREPCPPNRIIGTVRMGPTRSKDDFDQMALRIQEKWDTVLGTPTQIIKKGDLKAKEERKFKKLHCVIFQQMIAALEDGVIIPGAGDEGVWLKNHLAYFHKQVDDYDDDDFKGLLGEIEKREDLKNRIEW